MSRAVKKKKWRKKRDVRARRRAHEYTPRPRYFLLNARANDVGKYTQRVISYIVTTPCAHRLLFFCSISSLHSFVVAADVLMCWCVYRISESMCSYLDRSVSVCVWACLIYVWYTSAVRVLVINNYHRRNKTEDADKHAVTNTMKANPTNHQSERFMRVCV